MAVVIFIVLYMYSILQYKQLVHIWHIQELNSNTNIEVRFLQKIFDKLDGRTA